VGVMKNSSLIIFRASIFSFPRTEMGGGEDGGVDGFDVAGGGMYCDASASRSDSAAVFVSVQAALAAGGGGGDGGWIFLDRRSLYFYERSV